MARKVWKGTVVAKTERDFGISFVELMQNFLDDDIPFVEIAEMLDCSHSNLRRIFREKSIRYVKEKKEPMLVDEDDFTSESINFKNIFSRSWNNKNKSIREKY